MNDNAKLTYFWIDLWKDYSIQWMEKLASIDKLKFKKTILNYLILISK